MAVLSLDSKLGFLARCWKGGGFGFVDRVGFRDRICFVDRVGFRDRICFVDRVGFFRCFGSDRAPGVAPRGAFGVGRCYRL
jgi:hypothetical protein